MTDLQTAEVLSTEQTQPQYQFVVDADLVHIGGGSSVVDY